MNRRRLRIATLGCSGAALLALAALTPACSSGSPSPGGVTPGMDAGGGPGDDGSAGIGTDDGGTGDDAATGNGSDGSAPADGGGTCTPDGAAPGCGAPGDPTGVQATSADTFLSSLGVNTHIDQGYDATKYVQPLQYTGIRNIREGERNLQSTLMVHQQTGVMVDLGAYCDVTGALATAKQLAAAGALLSLEGANEPNNFPVTYNGQKGGGTGSWLPIAQCQRDLYTGVKADPVLKDYPVFTVSEEGAEQDNVGLQYLTIPNGSNLAMPDGTKYADYANCHNYVCSNSNVYVDNMAWNAASPAQNDPWPGDDLYGEFGSTWLKHYAGYSETDLRAVPRVTTETGWDTSSNPGGEKAQGVVLVNTYLSQFKQGWRYTFIYELVDQQGSTGDQGLYKTDYTPKLSATYIHDMTTVLADSKPLPSAGKLDYSIANEPATVHDLLLQKSSGAFELVVWDERASASDSVTVSLGKIRPSVKVYDVTQGTTPTQTLSNVSSVPLTLSDHAVILELAP